MYWIQLGVIFLFTFISLSSGQAEYCYQCIEGEWTQFCEISETVTQCHGEGSCFNQVTKNPSSGVLTSFKGCMTTWVCMEKQRQNPPECEQGIVTDKCVWCCSEDNCNEDIYTYSGTTPGSTTTTTTTTTIATTTEPPRNFLEEIGRCLDVYKRNVITTLVNPMERFGQFCSNVSTVFDCVSASMPECEGRDLDLIGTFVEYISDSLKAACPSKCDRDSGVTCTTETHKRLLGIFMNSGDVCHTLKREVITLRRCVAYSTYKCSSEVYNRFEYSVKSVDVAVELVCEQMPDDGDDDDDMMTTTTDMVMTTTAADDATTRPPTPCGVSSSLACLADVGNTIMRAKSENGDFTLICMDEIPYAIQCARSHSRTCSQKIRDRLELAITYIKTLVIAECAEDSGNVTTTPAPSTTTTMMMTTTEEVEMTTQPICDTAAARTCIVELWTLIEQVMDFEKACASIDKTIQCVVDNTIGCTEIEKTSLNKTLGNVLILIGNRCDDITQCPPNATLTVTEGGAAVWLEYSFTRSPLSICKVKGCRVYIDVIPDNYVGPYCRSSYPIAQIVIGSDENGGNSCSKEITADNWAEVHRFSVAAKTDFVVDGTQTRNASIVMRKVVNGQSIENRAICNVTVVVIDEDLNKHTCRSYNDPHLMTFDGLSYNNMQTGFYTLYKHKTLPYQVQMAYFACGWGSSCNCAVAVQSGDSVFVADLCNKRSKKQLCRKQPYFCHKTQNVKMYFHDQVTPGTRVFRRNNGKAYDVLLPTGTMVKIELWGIQINVAVVASAADREATEGMCGWYDGVKSNDLRLPDGTSITRLNKRRESTAFNNVWKLAASERIFYAVPESPYTPPQYCECRAGIDNPEGAPYSQCNAGALLELCDISQADEVTFSIPKIPSIQMPSRKRRQAEDPYADWDVEPKLEGDPSNSWTMTKALGYCQEYLVANSSMVRMCIKELTLDVQMEVQACAEDIMAIGSPEYAAITLDILKAMCMDEIQYNVSLTNSDEGIQLLDTLEDMNCAMDCSQRGQCVKGECMCEEGFRGNDCSLSGDMTVPKALYMENDGMCEMRQTTCQTAVMYGVGFEATGNLTCHLEPLEVMGLPSLADSPALVPAFFLTPNQLLCPLPDSAPYTISVSNDAVTPSAESWNYVPYDAVCFACAVGDDETIACTRKSDTCIIEGMCYAMDESNPNDSCMTCDPNTIESEWTRSYAGSCKDTSNLVVVIVCVVILLLLLIICIGLCIWCRKRKSQKEGTFVSTHQVSLKGSKEPDCQIIVEKRSNGNETEVTPLSKQPLEESCSRV